jgi:hypothetical protein
MELSQPSLTLSIKGFRCLAPRIARDWAEGTISRAISWITLASFLSCIISHVSSKRSSWNNESSGTICLALRRVRQTVLLVSAIPNSDLRIKLPLVSSRILYYGLWYGALLASLGFWSLGVVELGAAEPASDSLPRKDEEDFFLASRWFMLLSGSKYTLGQRSSLL